VILGILQARVSSKRLPAKVLLPLVGKPMLLRQFERLQRSHFLDQLIIATSTDSSDDPIEDLCKTEGIHCFRGSLEDVLSRFYHASLNFKPDQIARFTGDCPLSDPKIVDRVIQFHLTEKFDYSSNSLDPTFPDGLDTEVFTFSALEMAYQKAKLTSDREHVTPFLYHHPETFHLGSYRNETNLSHLRLTIDEAVDYEVVSLIFEQLFPRKPDFDLDDALNFLSQNKILQTLNRKVIRNEGYQKSLAMDNQVL